MADAFQVTVLESLDGALTKSVTLKDGSYRTEPFGARSWFSRRVSPPISTALELSTLVREIEQSIRCCVVTGAPSQAFPLDQPVRRLKHDRPDHAASLVEQASAFHPIDLDGLDVPGVNVLRDPANAAKAAARFLGIGFDTTTFHYQFTASQRPDSTNLRLRLYFVTDRPHTNEERKRWAKPLIERGIPIDRAIYQAAQPIYTAAPEFVGCIDPLPCRSGYVEGEADRVHLVILDRPVRTVRTVAPFVSTNPPSYESARVRYVLHMGLEMARTFEKHGGRHGTLMRVALNARRYGLAAEQTKWVCGEVANVLPARECGPITQAEADDVAMWCFQHVPGSDSRPTRKEMLATRWRAVGVRP